MEELSKRELLALKDIHLTGEASDKELAHRFVKSDIIADLEVGSFVLTQKGESCWCEVRPRCGITQRNRFKVIITL